jgi:hypothetical protein
MDTKQFAELILQSLEHELGGRLVYETALKCVVNDELREEWEKYLEETRSHVETLTTVCRSLEIDASEETPGRSIVRHLGESLVDAMEMARAAGTPEAAELVACECVVIAETKDHLNWELIGKCATKLRGDAARAVKEAHEQVGAQARENCDRRGASATGQRAKSLTIHPRRGCSCCRSHHATKAMHGHRLGAAGALRINGLGTSRPNCLRTVRQTSFDVQVVTHVGQQADQFLLDHRVTLARAGLQR